jgi:hypothetical protein
MEIDTDAFVTRDADVAYIMECIEDGDCCSVVGLSNTGKSTLLRSLPLPAVRRKYLRDRADEYIFVYIDFNLMLELTEQGFYELILRSTLAELKKLEIEQRLLDRVEASYRNLVNPDNPFLVPLGFNEGLTAISEGLKQRIVFLFDEFDEPFAGLDERVLLNLRALKDKYGRRFSYVVATDQPLTEPQRGAKVAEFNELFALNTLFISALGRDDAKQVIAQFVEEEEVEFSPDDVVFIIAQAGGHPGLLEATCRVLSSTKGRILSLTKGRVLSEASRDYPDFYDDQSYKLVRERLDNDTSIRAECAKLWNGLTAEEQEALTAFVSRPEEPLNPELERSLRQKAIIEEKEGEPAIFGQLFEGFARRQRLVKRGEPQGVRVDVDSGHVWVDGELAPDLTDLEYRLLLLLYGRLDKICDKYEMVESVWGQDYIDEVDDARIGKLVNRLRQKIEPDPSEPRYLITVRGRGYRLVSP